MEYAKGKDVISKLFKTALTIGAFIVLAITIPFIAIFAIRALFVIAVFGVLVWYSLKLVKCVKKFIYKSSTKKDATTKSNVFSSDADITNTNDINYDDGVIIDVDYEKVI
ncbi:hypothetical protein [Clostridium estertheticum]|uniref:hypothetical protein n=1 Tax=Clostridium estertheticum TaxID=238834 RepID=UPI001C0C1EDD|nr:hypothetical protein [Clostridium estertheticum]MBU3072219.1 hypothetical protein [Clostridium estertheticum]MBU3162311.1 hypothetical protein [Clostridium estertheticum]MBU3184627.1 hypothetical protein [Clostridium estertheticum]MBX4261488.1 hypothetical protein [Clostridium estertheticum]MCB2339388.1 hypothetical protein [Clostridium estertheticum]